MNNDLRIKIKVDSNTGELLVTRKEFDKLGTSVKKVDKDTTDYTKKLVQLGQGVVAIYAVNKAFEVLSDTAKGFVNTAASFEKFDATLKTIEGSSAKAQQSMKWIEDFASVTPFNIDKVTSSFISLKSYGLDPTNGLLRTLGDTGAAMGKDIQQAVEAMADAVVGENERLKEFGIRASVMGEEIKYSWTNASGEMRQTIIDNNSAIIESTLSSIFNSKYAGAMEEQSKTWNGLISNMQDNWTIFQKNLMSSGVFDYLKAIVTVVGEYMSEAFGNTLESSEAFSRYVIEGIKSVISSIGYTYDALETFGDYFAVVGALGKVAFGGLGTAFNGVAAVIVKTFESTIDLINTGFEVMINGVLAGLNLAIEGVNLLGGNLQQFSYIDLGNVDIGGNYLIDATVKSAKFTADASRELVVAYDALMDTGRGQTFVDDILGKIDVAYENIKNAPETSTQKTDFGDSVLKEIVSPETLKNFEATVATNEEVQKTIEKVNETFSDLNETLVSDTSNNDDTYTVVNAVNDSFNTLNDTSSNTVTAITNITDALDTFIFQFNDTFLNSIDGNIDSLRSIGSSSSANVLTYEDALFNALTKRDALISNPLDTIIGSQYTDAYNIFIDSANDYLSNMGNFASQSDYLFAQASVASQTSQFEDTAYLAVDVLDSMNSLLDSINQSFADGILTADEKAVISGVADTVNTKNAELLGTTGAISSAIGSQTYYDNTDLYTGTDINAKVNTISGFATGTDISSQTYYDNEKLMKDATFALADVSGLYTGTNIGVTETSPLNDFATDTNVSAQTYYDNNGLYTDDYAYALAKWQSEQMQTIEENADDRNTTIDDSTNSVGDAVALLMGSGTDGISLNSVEDMAGDMSVSTGLDVSNLSNLDTLTSTTNAAIAATDISGTTAKTLDNLQIEKETINYLDYTRTYYDPSVSRKVTTTYDGTNVENAGTSTTYSYYAQGGFTGAGLGRPDSSGFKPAGIVHEDEWVAPKWMVQNNPSLFGALEMHRLGKSSVSNTSSNTASSSNSSNKTDGYLYVLQDEMKQMNFLLRQLTDGGNAMKTKAVS